MKGIWGQSWCLSGYLTMDCMIIPFQEAPPYPNLFFCWAPAWPKSERALLAAMMVAEWWLEIFPKGWDREMENRVKSIMREMLWEWSKVQMKDVGEIVHGMRLCSEFSFPLAYDHPVSGPEGLGWIGIFWFSRDRNSFGSHTPLFWLTQMFLTLVGVLKQNSPLILTIRVLVQETPHLENIASTELLITFPPQI